MAETPKTTTWMWEAGTSINGVRIDLHDAQLEWYDEVGCACGDSTVEQSYADFQADGPALGNLPEDVLTELQNAVNLLTKSGR